jgi:hypothetical protein
MRTFFCDVETEESWDRFGRTIRVKANTIRGAMRRAMRLMRADEMFYEVRTRVRGCELPQPVWDAYNNLLGATHFELKL